MTLHLKLRALLVEGNFVEGSDGVYSARLPSFAQDQEVERALRERVAAQRYEDYLLFVSEHHSIPVMDHEVDRFLSVMPAGALILDIGGCWGWHWRKLGSIRPDVGVLIVDFVRANLGHARNLLGSLVGSQVGLVHADATRLPIPDRTSSFDGFDGVWTVQTFQHIPDYVRACREAHRVLRAGGRFANYSLHAAPLGRMIYRLFGKQFHTQGDGINRFHLNRANESQLRIVREIFGGEILERHTECLFHPDLGLKFTGRSGSVLGRLDARLGDLPGIGRWVARQRSFEAMKS